MMMGVTRSSASQFEVWMTAARWLLTVFLFIYPVCCVQPGVKQRSVSGSVPVRGFLCGDDRCICHTTGTADCSGTTLNYIPRLPDNVSVLFFNRNGLISIPSDTFFLNVTNAVIHLEIIYNELTTVSPGAFSPLKNLSYLDLSENLLTYEMLSRIIMSLEGLGELLADANTLGPIEDKFFEKYPLPRLWKLSLYENGISPLNFTSFLPLKSLKHLLLSKNGVSKRIWTDCLPHLVYLELNSNDIVLFPETCRDGESLFPSLEVVLLADNQLHVVPERLCLPKLTYLDLSGNVFYELVADMFSLERFPVLGTLVLNSMPILLGVDKFSFRNSSIKQLLFNFNDLPFGNEDVVQAGLFHGCDDLRHLEVARNDLSHVSSARFSRLFGGLRKLEYLDLSHTELSRIHPRNFHEFPNLKQLVLSRNKLTDLPDGAFDGLVNLVDLSLDGNSISVVQQAAFGKSVRRRLARLDLSNNPFVCSCDLQWFQHWLTSDRSLFSNSSSRYMCRNIHNTTVQSFYLNPQSCLLSQSASTYISVTVSIVMATLTLTFLLYRYRWHIRLVLYEAFRGRGERWRRLQEEHFQYDVFVSYDKDDLEWVLKHLMPKLETEMGLRLCVHERDFIPGQNIVDNIVDCVQTSKKVLMVFSSHFAKSQWCQFELNLCLNHVMDNDDALLIVMLHDIPSRDLTPAMMAVMKVTTYIEWFYHPDAIASFWGRIQIALNEILPST